MSPYEDGILRSLRRISRAIDLHSRQLSSRVGLTGPQLVCLRHVERQGAMTPSQLAREVHLSQATVTGILDRLAAAGWVIRTRSEIDRRRVTVALTDAARSLLLRAPSPLNDRFLRRLAALPEEEQATIQRTLETVVQMMDMTMLEEPPVVIEPTLPPSVEEASRLLSVTAIAAPGDESEVTK
ncbi:MAG: MarR family transcriptional regulator [Myxococcales bacterium]|nr:MarR family transcriptional regulator [Myxococcales bacterium]